MEKEVKTILGIALVYTMITGGISLITRFSGLFTDLGYGLNVKAFLNINGLWFIVTAFIAAVLVVYYKKYNAEQLSGILNDRVLCLSAGLLVVIQGAISLSGTLPMHILSIQSAFSSAEIMEDKAGIIIFTSVLSGTITVLALLGQIVLGILLIRRYKNKMQAEE